MNRNGHRSKNKYKRELKLALSVLFCIYFLLVKKYKLTLIYFLQVPSRHPWLQGHSAILGQRISATKATTQDVSSAECAMTRTGRSRLEHRHDSNKDVRG